MKQHLAIVAWAANPAVPHLCAAPFFHAAAAAAMDVEVEVYFTSAAVLLLKRGVAASLHSGPQQRETVYEFMRQAVAQGARFYACSQALGEYGLTLAELIPETSGAAGAATYAARSLDEDWVTVVY
jgi:predicted peroxiredoxin